MMYRIDNPMKSRSFAAHPASCASPALRRKAAANETWRWKKQKNNLMKILIPWYTKCTRYMWSNDPGEQLKSKIGPDIWWSKIVDN